MNRIQKAGIAVAMVGSTLSGGAVGAALFNGSSASAATGSSSTAPPPSPGSNSSDAAPSGTFHPNENASHEATESPQREAQENAGQRPTVP
jgi:hypothetical protein